MVNSALDAFLKQGAVKERVFSDAFEYSADAQKSLAGK
jgi:hypothetical protein